MIHFTCDCCGRPIDADQECRYIVRLEVYPALDTQEENEDDDLDNLQAIDDMLEQLDQLELEQDDCCGYEQQRYDLCERCRHEFLKNPLGRLAMAKIGFSDN